MSHSFPEHTFLSLTSFVPSLWMAKLVTMAGCAPVLLVFAVFATDITFAQLLADHQVGATALALFTFSAAASAMRDPPDGFYKWFFRFINTMSANSMDFTRGLHEMRRETTTEITQK